MTKDPTPIRVIEVVPYDPAWPAQFEAIAASIRAKLGPLALSVEHVGSTSVPGLAAKPIIDLDVVISSRLRLPEVISKLAELSYVHEGNLGIPGREAFMWPAGSQRHHLYVCSVNTPNLHYHLLFRDYLRQHPEKALEYGQLKEKLARGFPHDIDGYMLGKQDLISRIMQEAEALSGFDLHQP
ncbi:GrpB family protein [Deinococcus wulumuqiensis]|uniref:GrpB family protein n=1 Tax=Deinococcus wulumuqiensis TaxID=980427 RepID=A0A345IH15_9DEIO|nr:GrpB family protein [Deinococcus wulumuqiensis]AXG98987.1 GrpB family protein [Deinococcus wulumuqiensis]